MTGLLVIVDFGVLVTHSVSTPRKKVVAEIKPVLDSEYIAVLNTPIYPDIPIVGHDFVSIGLQESLSQHQVAKVPRPRENCSTGDIVFSRPRTLKSGKFFFGKEVCRSASHEFYCGRLPDVFDGNTYEKRMADGRDTRWSNGFYGVGYPGALILPHLTLNGINLLLRGPNLLASMSPSNSGITASVLSLLGEYSSLSLHFSELAIEHNSSNDCNYHPGPSKRQSLALKGLKNVIFNYFYRYGFTFFNFVCGFFVSRVGTEIPLGRGGFDRWLRIRCLRFFGCDLPALFAAWAVLVPASLLGFSSITACRSRN